MVEQTSQFKVGDVVRSSYEGVGFESVVHDAGRLGYPGAPYLMLDVPGFDTPQWWYADRCERVVPSCDASSGADAEATPTDDDA